jgi:hypothetical protein
LPRLSASNLGIPHASKKRTGSSFSRIHSFSVSLKFGHYLVSQRNTLAVGAQGLVEAFIESPPVGCATYIAADARESRKDTVAWNGIVEKFFPLVVYSCGPSGKVSGTENLTRLMDELSV